MMAINTTLNATLEKLKDRYAQLEPGDRIAMSALAAAVASEEML